MSRDSRVLPPSIYTSLRGKESGDGKGIKAGVFRGYVDPTFVGTSDCVDSGRGHCEWDFRRRALEQISTRRAKEEILLGALFWKRRKMVLGRSWVIDMAFF